MSCNLCRRSQRDGYRPHVQCEGIESVKECPTGEVAVLAPENQKFWALFLRMLPGLVDGLGGFDYSAITTVMDVYGVPPGERLVIFDKALAVIYGIQEVREAERV